MDTNTTTPAADSNTALILLQNLLVAVKSAIEIGDWKVDGRCDPELEIAHVETFLAENGIKTDAAQKLTLKV